MTDVEMTKLCAKAMGYKDESLSTHWGGLPMFASEVGLYDPLQDDAQAMALVKRFKLDIEALFGFKDAANDAWVVQGTCSGWEKTRHADLNRAVVECVAKMQEYMQAKTEKTG